MDKASIKRKNALYPGYSCCSKCGGNWGWKKHVTHMTNEHNGLFLFCEECDKIVTLEERWEALDEWKIEMIIETTSSDHYTMEEKRKEIIEIFDMEFIEFPRK